MQKELLKERYLTECLADDKMIVTDDDHGRKRVLVLKSVRGRVDYNLFNYCATCGFKLPKEMMRCPDCRQKVRTRPWHRPKVIDMKRI